MERANQDYQTTPTRLYSYFRIDNAFIQLLTLPLHPSLSVLCNCLNEFLVPFPYTNSECDLI